MAVLAERAAAGPLQVALFDGVIGPGWSWSQRDEAMTRRLLAGSPCGARTLAVAGNAHTPASPTDLGIPLGAWLARQRPGIGGDPDPLRRRAFLEVRVTPICPHGPARRYQDAGALVLDLPAATDTVVPQRP